MPQPAQCDHPARSVFVAYGFIVVLGWGLVAALYYLVNAVLDAAFWLIDWVMT